MATPADSGNSIPAMPPILVFALDRIESVAWSGATWSAIESCVPPSLYTFLYSLLDIVLFKPVKGRGVL